MQARDNEGIATEFRERAGNSLAPHLIMSAPDAPFVHAWMLLITRSLRREVN